MDVNEDIWFPINTTAHSGIHFEFNPYTVKIRSIDYLTPNSHWNLTVDNPNTINTEEDCSKVRNQMQDHDHGQERFRHPRNLRIVLGHACNFRCKYCSQKHESLYPVSVRQVENFMHQLDETIYYDQLQVVQFWGGEPLLYWDAIKDFISYFNKRFEVPGAGYSIVTNGSLLHAGIAKYILNLRDKYQRSMGIVLSHDGPGQYLRGMDVLSGKNKENILLLAKELLTEERDYLNQGRNFAVNPVITSATPSLKTLVEWFDNRFDRKVPIAECIPVIPIQEGTEQYAPCGGNFDQYEEQLYKEFFSGQVALSRFDNYTLLHDLFMQKLSNPNFKVPQNKALCFTTDPYMLTLDMEGNVLPCQTYDKTQGLMPDGTSSSVCGNIFTRQKKKFTFDRDRIKTKFPPLYSWVTRGDKCMDCPVLSYCMGGCPYLTPESGHEVDCKVKRRHFGALLRFSLSMILGTHVGPFEW